MSGIEALPAEVVHLITAGEVIDSLAAVVRELAENAVDAGATRIAVSLYPEQWRIRVADNGMGMSLEDLKQAATAHSTSKIRSSEDLWKISSLGFRGEALHSLARLAVLEIVSCSAIAQAGWWVGYNSQGEAVELEPAAIAPGTIVTVSQIFERWAARRDGLPPMAQQLRAVQSTIHQLALCHPRVTWQVQQNDQDWFSLWAGKTAQQILPQILRDVQGSDLQELVMEVAPPSGVNGSEQREEGKDNQYASPASPASPASLSTGRGQAQGTSPTSPASLSTGRGQAQGTAPTSPASLYLLLGLPDRCHRHRPDWVKVALNGRFVQVPELEQTILAGFRRTLPRDRFPVCLIHLQVPLGQIDWNRTPAKSEVYLHHLDFWREQVATAIEQALRMNPATLSEAAYSKQVGQVLKTAETQQGYGVSRQIAAVDAIAESPEASQTPPSPGTISLRAIAQVHNMYILAEHPTGVWLIEQHIAHERVLYEQLCDRWQIVPLPSPVVLNQLTPAQVEQLQRLGLEVELFGDHVWVVRSAPEPLIQREDCADALLELSLGGDLQAAQVATACRSAIRNGTSLSLQEMQILLDQWQQTRNPRTCPHGRPICLTLEESSLSRFFRRHWVIGKSHGI